MSLITIIGRGHGGTRAMSHTLIASNVFMGDPLNRSGDLLPPQSMYDACRVLAHSRNLAGRAGVGLQLAAYDADPGRVHRPDREYLKTGASQQGRAQGVEDPGNDTGLSLDRAHVS